NAPSARLFPYQNRQVAVWTGSEMIVWGGCCPLDTGGRYNPGTDSWIATSLTNAPSARYEHTAVWTGNEMIVWGGIDGSNTGGRYDPSTDNWTATSIVDAPSARAIHTAVWTGSEMIVWGGTSDTTGGKYCAQSGAPITLDARVRRQGGNRVVLLTWSPADGGGINVLRNGVVISTTDDDGSAKDSLGTQTGIFIYQ